MGREGLFEEKSELAHLYLLSTPQTGGNIVKTFRWEHKATKTKSLMAFNRGMFLVILFQVIFPYIITK